MSSRTIMEMFISSYYSKVLVPCLLSMNSHSSPQFIFGFTYIEFSTIRANKYIYTQTSVVCGYWEQKGLTSALTDQGPYEFAVSGAGDDYIDLANTYLFVEAQTVDDDDTALDGGEDVGPVNIWMHSLFNYVSASLNEKLVSPPTSLYPYRAYIETLLSYGPAAKESQLTGVMWYKDTPGHQDKTTADNKGFTSRKALTAQSKSVQMMGNLHSNYDEVETCSP